MKAKLIFTGLALVAITAFASAQCQGNGAGKCDGKCKGANFVDTNKNGICDNYENRTDSVSGNKLKCKGQGHKQGKGKNFVDANKNGVCDNYENRMKK